MTPGQVLSPQSTVERSQAAALFTPDVVIASHGGDSASVAVGKSSGDSSRCAIASQQVAYAEREQQDNLLVVASSADKVNEHAVWSLAENRSQSRLVKARQDTN